ncbi:hypothetical protein UlMin_020337 [Ulmus minor]
MDMIQDTEDLQFGMFEKRLPCFGCGIDWFLFVFPLMWYYATILYFGNYYQRDPRERAGLAASAIAVYYTVKDESSEGRMSLNFILFCTLELF